MLHFAIEPAGNINNGGADIFIIKYDSSWDMQWAKQFGTASDDICISVAADSTGNVYAIGWTNGGFDGNVNAGNSDIFMVKLDSTGVKQWTKQFGTSSYELATGLTIDSSDNIFVYGSTYGSLDSYSNLGNFDIFLAKYNSNGTKQWLKQFGTSSADVSGGISINSSNDIYMAGRTDGGLDGNSSSGGSDAFLTKFNASGVKQWTRQFGSASTDFGTGVVVGSDDNIYLSGYTDGGVGGNSNIGSYDTFVAKYDSSGAQQWLRQLGTSAMDIGGITVDDNGYMYVGGYTYGGFDGNINAGGADVFVIKYDPSWTRQWTIQLGTTDDDIGGVVLDLSGNVFVSGHTHGGIDGNANAGGTDIFVLKYDSNGNKQ